MTTLLKIRRKVRRLTATPSTLQLPDSLIDEYINTYYEQDMPAELKLWELHNTYTFFTQAYEDRYTLPVNEILGVNPPVYIDGYESMYTESRAEFFNIYPAVEFQQMAATGDGTAGPYTFTMTNTPVQKRSFYVTVVDSNDVTRTIVDDPDTNPLTESTANLVDEQDVGISGAISRGTINYVNGDVTVTFGDTVDGQTNIFASSVPYQPGRPTSMLFYNKYFTVRPIPNKAYKVVIEAYVLPSTLLGDDSSPNLNQWWQLIAFGAALKVLEDRQDNETLAALMPRYDEQKQMALHRTILQQTPLRTPTIYSQETLNGYGYQYGGFY